MELIRELQEGGAIWAINTGRSVDLLESGLADFSFPIRPDFILTNEARRFSSRAKWKQMGSVRRLERDAARVNTQIYSVHRNRYLPKSSIS